MKRPRKNTMEWEDVVDETYERIKTAVGNDADFKNWMRMRKEVGWTFDPLMIARLYNVCKKKLDKNNDYVCVITGREGEGKSTIGTQIGSWIDPSFKVDNICFRAESVIKAWQTFPKKSPVQIDEGGTVLFSRQALSKVGVNMIKLFMTIRVKQFFHIIICPNFKDLDPYIREHRVDMIVDVLKKGSYRAYFGKAIEIINRWLYLKKKVNQIRVPEGTFWNGDFNRTIPKNFDLSFYEKRKLEYVDHQLKTAAISVGDVEQKYVQTAVVARELGVKVGSVINRIQKGHIKAKKVGQRWFIPFEERERLVKASN